MCVTYELRGDIIQSIALPKQDLKKKNLSLNPITKLCTTATYKLKSVT